MKTRYEMIYDFMVALASNPNFCDVDGIDFDVYEHTTDQIVQLACALTDKYLGGDK